MDDRFMHELEREPRPGFARELRGRLRSVEGADPAAARWTATRLMPVLAPALTVAALVALFLFPSVRASAQAFLDLFRIRTFTAVSVDPDRMQQLQDGKLDLKSLIGDRIQTVKEPGPPQVMASPQLAGAAAGFMVGVPALLPAGLMADTVTVCGDGEARLTVDTARLRRILEALDIRDLRVPDAIDGQVIDLRMPPVVEQRFRGDALRARLLQSRGPELSLPTGVNLADLGEIGLRVLGLDAAEARRLAQTVDWRSTMLVPVPGNAASFRQVEVRGHQALLVTSIAAGQDRRRREGVLLLWSDGDRVYALGGNLDGVDLMQMANSIQ